jgi:small-conductance mechanosensitive channel
MTLTATSPAPLTATTAPDEPDPSPTQRMVEDAGDAGAAALGADECGTQDLTPCGLLHRWTGDQELAELMAGVVGTGLLILVVVIGAAILRWVLLRAIRRTVERVEAEGPRRSGRIDLFEPTDPISRERKVQRAKAIGSILKAIVSIVVWTAAAFVVLGTIGVNITGLVAGAGIVGIAIGFGAQTLVQDFVSGLFMIAEDQYGVGDVIDMGEATGVVEAVGLRTTRLRAVDGTVWHVRNGEVVRVGNMSQGWSRAVLDVSVGYGEDLTRVMETLKELGSDMRQDPDWGDKFLDEPEVWGVEALAADGITERMIIKTVPLEQWVVAREMRRRIKYRFDSLGIEIPFPQRTVWMRTEGPGSDADADTEAGTEAAAPAAIPPAPQSTRGEAAVAQEDAPAPGTGEPFGASAEPDPRERR